MTIDEDMGEWIKQRKFVDKPNRSDCGFSLDLITPPKKFIL